jgi:hypothetical protein
MSVTAYILYNKRAYATSACFRFGAHGQLLTHAPQQTVFLLDHLVGGSKQQPRHCEAEHQRS